MTGILHAGHVPAYISVSKKNFDLSKQVFSRSCYRGNTPHSWMKRHSVSSGPNIECRCIRGNSRDNPLINDGMAIAIRQTAISYRRQYNRQH